MKYIYKARTRQGKIEIGSIEAYSKEAAVNLLQKYDIFLTSLEEKTDRKPFFDKMKFTRKASKKDLAIFFRQLSFMMESSVPVVQSLSSLAPQVEKASLKEIIFKVSNLVEQGTPLSEAFATYPETFNNFYVNLVRSGEASGKIASTLYDISSHLEREYDVATQVKQAMIYPIFLVSVLFFVVAIVITQIVPRIKDIIEQTGNTPPFFTGIILNFYQFLASYWLILLIALFFLVVLAIYYFRTKEGREKYNNVSLKTPFLGKLLKKVFVSRFCSSVSTLLIAGISINRALKITGDTVDNVVYKNIIAQIEQKVYQGEKISLAIAEYPDYFPSFIVQIIKIGEATGKLDKTLMDVVNFYEKEIKRSIDLFSRLLEPIMIVILGVFVVILAMSIFSSIYSVLDII